MAAGLGLGSLGPCRWLHARGWWMLTEGGASGRDPEEKGLGGRHPGAPGPGLLAQDQLPPLSGQPGAFPGPSPGQGEASRPATTHPVQGGRLPDRARKTPREQRRAERVYF